MQKKLKIYNYVRWVLDIIFLICLYIPIYKYIDCVTLSVLELSGGNAFVTMLITVGSVMLIYYIVKTLSIIWHEFGHLLFGLKAKLEFIEFNVLSLSFTMEDNKLKLRKGTKLPKNIKGYCNMTIGKDSKYDIKAVKLYFMGGITFNVIAVVISLLLFLIIKNELIDIILIFNMVMNAYSAIHNSIPAILRSGTATDALQYLYCLEDDTYFESVSKIQRVNILLTNGVELKDIDKELFVKPKNINSKSDVLNAQLYIDYLVANEKYKECVKFIEDVLEKGKELMSKPDETLIKVQLLNVLFELGKVEDIKEYWNEDDTKNLEFMGNLSPVFMLMNYLYVLSIEKDEKKADKILDKYNKMDKSKLDKNTLNDLEELMSKINKSIS